jgi:hypothetical protein
VHVEQDRFKKAESQQPAIACDRSVEIEICREINWRKIMEVIEYTRSKGRRLTYRIMFDQGEYFIERDGILKKSFPDSIIAGIAPEEAKPFLMLRTAIADIEALIGMDE